MSEGFAYIDILLFAAVAAFIALRLRSVLGRKTGEERRRPSRAENSNDNVVPLPERTPPPPPPPSDMDDSPLVDDSALAGVRAIKGEDSSFDAEHFLTGARAAFGMIVDAFARGDRDALRPLLADDVYESFAAVISEREANEQVMDAEIVDMRHCSVVNARLIDHRALVTVKFVTAQRNTLRDASGSAVEGEGEVDEIVDFWTFERDVRSGDPNWFLSETGAPD